MSTLVVGLVPIVILALVATFGLRSLDRSTDRGVAATRQAVASGTITADLQSEANRVGSALDRLVAERVDDVARWARQPSIHDAGYRLAELGQQSNFLSLDYQDTPIEDPWWTDAMADGRSLGSITLDPESERYVLPISARVAGGPGDGVAVIRADLAIEAIQELADAFTGGGTQLSFITADQRLIAETESSHDPARVGVDTLAPDDLSTGVIAAVEAGRGSLTESGVVYGYTPIDWTRTELSLGPEVGRPTPGGERWSVVVSEPSNTALTNLDGLDELSDDLDRARAQLAIVTAIVLLVAFVACGIVAHLMARKLVTPIRRLTTRAQVLAEEDLTAVARADDPEPEFASLQDHSMNLNAGNELDELAASFDSVHHSAVEMAAEQAQLRRITTDMFANLGRRNQSLVKRQLGFIEELEKSEEDPERLASLFKLDHLATRMRRNAESLLVIAGDRGASRRSSPVRVRIVVEAALGEVENFERVDISEIEPASILGRVVAGLAHILAELIENALAFSPPEEPVRVVGVTGDTHYTLAVIDRGIGLQPEEIDALNERLFAGSNGDLTSSKQLGLLVVGKLADRYELQIGLVQPEAGGLAATVEIPNSLVEPAEAGSTPTRQTEPSASPALWATTTAHEPNGEIGGNGGNGTAAHGPEAAAPGHEPPAHQASTTPPPAH